MNDTISLTMSNNSAYCGSGLDDFHSGYVQVHGYASLLVCVFGCVANTLNIMVLSRREMISPTNAILTGLAVADLVVMLEYIPYACSMYLPQIARSREDIYSYGWTWFVLFHSIFAQVCHTISIWLTVTLAVWRYIAIAHPQRNREWCRMPNTIVVIIGAYVVCPLMCVPFFLGFSIVPKVETLNDHGNPIGNSSFSEGARNVTLYFVGMSDMGKANDKILFNVNFWIYSVVIKIIPCVALTVLSLRLILALLETKQRRQKLTAASALNGDVSNKKPKKASRMLEKERQTDRTTKMLLAVLLLFLITEFPQGILGLLSAMLGDQFFYGCYVKLGEVMDILALINSAINFILYCAMSRQFRKTFSQLFRPRIFNRWLPVPQHNGDHNGHTTHQTQVTQV